MLYNNTSWFVDSQILVNQLKNAWTGIMYFFFIKSKVIQRAVKKVMYLNLTKK